jgi:hypothetical protein
MGAPAANIASTKGLFTAFITWLLNAKLETLKSNWPAKMRHFDRFEKMAVSGWRAVCTGYAGSILSACQHSASMMAAAWHEIRGT